MKPSKIAVLKAKKAWFLLSGFSALVWKGCVYCRKESTVKIINKSPSVDNKLKSHEMIHVKQAECMKDSWNRFYIKYLWDWLCNLPLIIVHIKAPYYFIPVEMEAYLNQDNWKYYSNSVTEQWKAFGKIHLRDKYRYAKEYFNFEPKPSFGRYVYDSIIKNIG